MPMVLIVDDRPMVCDSVAAALQAEGYGTVQAPSGPVALKFYKSHKPDAVLLDIKLPGRMSGLETLAELRKMDPRARVAILTGYGFESVVSEATRLGAKDFISKPWDHERLLSAVERLAA